MKRNILAPLVMAAALSATAAAQTPLFGTKVDERPKGEAGVLVNEVVDYSPAAGAGIAAGDIIVRLGDTKIRNLDDFTNFLDSHKSGDVIAVAFMRGGDDKTVELALGRKSDKLGTPDKVRTPKAPRAVKATTIPPQPKAAPAEPSVILRGPDEKSQVAKRRTYLGVYSMPNDEGSLVIRDVIPDTPAERAGLKRNDVILSFAGKTPKTSEELAADIRSRKPGEKVEVRIRREGNEMALAIPLGEAPEDEVIAQGVMPVTPGQHDLWVKEGESFVAKGDLAERNKELAAQAREMAAQQREMAKEMATQQREMAKDIAAQQREFTKRQEREVAELHKQVADLQAQLSKLSSELASMRDLIAKLKQQQR